MYNVYIRKYMYVCVRVKDIGYIGKAKINIENHVQTIRIFERNFLTATTDKKTKIYSIKISNAQNK